jgi:hypothetical protein
MTHDESKLRRKLIAEDYKNGLPTQEILEKHSVSSTILYSALKEHNIPIIHRAKDTEDGKRFCVMGKHFEVLDKFINKAEGKLGKGTYCKACIELYRLGLNTTKRWAYNVSRRYNITVEGYLELLKQQNNKCAICGNKSERRLAVDHNHITGVVRALLCYPCNTILGLAKESPERLDAASAYLRQHIN